MCAKKYEVELTDEDEKALAYVAVDIQAWINNAVYNRIRRAIDEICELAIKQEGVLTDDDKIEVVKDLEQEGVIITTVKKFPDKTKRKIVKKAILKSAAEREAEWEAEHGGGDEPAEIPE